MESLFFGLVIFGATTVLIWIIVSVCKFSHGEPITSEDVFCPIILGCVLGVWVMLLHAGWKWGVEEWKTPQSPVVSPTDPGWDFLDGSSKD